MPTITNVDDQRYVKALSHPLRVRILGILEEQPASPVELSQVLDATLGTISYHVRQLNELGLLELVRETPRRGAIEHHYRAKPRPKSGGASWDSVSVIAAYASKAGMAGTARIPGTMSSPGLTNVARSASGAASCMKSSRLSFRNSRTSPRRQVSNSVAPKT